MFLFLSNLFVGSAPVVAVMAVAIIAGLGKLMPVVIGLTAVDSVMIDIVVQPGFPLLDVPAAAVIIIRVSYRGSA